MIRSHTDKQSGGKCKWRIIIIIKKFKRRKSNVRFNDNSWGADLAEIESWCSKKKNVQYLLCVVDVILSNLILVIWIN